MLISPPEGKFAGVPDRSIHEVMPAVVAARNAVPNVWTIHNGRCELIHPLWPVARDNALLVLDLRVDLRAGVVRVARSRVRTGLRQADRVITAQVRAGPALTLGGRRALALQVRLIALPTRHPWPPGCRCPARQRA